MKTIKNRMTLLPAVAVGSGILFLFIFAACTWSVSANSGEKIEQQVIDETIVVADPSDDYYSLARDIARQENLMLVDRFVDVLEFYPKYVILVASPAGLTAGRLAEIGSTYMKHDYYPGLGIISGSTLDSARRLWERRNLVERRDVYWGGDTDIMQLIFQPAIFDISDGAGEKIALTKGSLIEALKQADYFYWSRHTGPKDWSWNEEYGNWSEDDQLLAKDIPALKAAVIYSLTCRPFQPWVEGSLSLAFIDKGAAAYLGFVNTPHTVAFMKHGDYLPGLTSWSEFPLGLVAQIHNKAAVKTIFKTPQLFMLGDPRIHLSKDQPYRIISDNVKENGKRTIEGLSNEKGILSVKIENGAEYRFLDIKGLTSAGEDDFFYNSKLHMLDVGADKYIMFPQQGARFEIELARQAPFGRHVTDALVDAFDYAWVVLWLNTYADSSPHIPELSIAVFVGLLLFKIFKQKKSLRAYDRIFLVALGFVLIRLVYFLLRRDDYAVSASLVGYTPLQIGLGCLGVFSAVAGGLIIMKDSLKRVKKFSGLLFAVLRQFWMAGFYLLFITLLNVFTPITKNTETWMLSYQTFWLSFIVLLCEMSIVLILYRYVICDGSKGRAV